MTLIFLSLKIIAAAQAPLVQSWRFNSISGVSSTAYSPDGTLLVAGGYGGVQIYQASTMQAIRGLMTSATDVQSVSFSKDGQTLLLGGENSANGVVELWSVKDWTLKGSFPTDATAVQSCALSPNGKLVALGGANPEMGVLEVWNIASHKRTLSLPTKSSLVNSIAFSTDDRTLAAGGESTTSGVLEVWSLQSGHLSASLPTAATNVTSIAIAKDGVTLADGGSRDEGNHAVLEEWDLSKQKVKFNLHASQQTVNSIAFSHDGKSLVDVETTITYGYHYSINYYGLINIWSSTTGKLISYNDDPFYFGNVAFSPDDNRLSIGGSYGIELWTTQPAWISDTATSGATYNPFGPPVFSSDSHYVVGSGLATGAYGGPVELWNSATGVATGYLGATNGTISAAYSFSPDGKNLAVAYTPSQPYIVIFDVTTNLPLETFPTNSLSISSLQYSPDGTQIAIAGQGENYYYQVLVYNVANGTKITSFQPAAFGSNLQVRYSPDGSIIADAGGEFSNVVELWEPKSGSLLYSLKTAATESAYIGFSPDGKTVAVGGSLNAYGPNAAGVLELWDAATGTRTSTLNLATGTTQITCPVFTPDGKSLYAASDVGIQVFDTSTGNLLGYFSDPALYLAFSPDGTKLAYETSQADLIVCPKPSIHSYEISSVTLSPNVIGIGGSATGTVTLTAPAPTGGVTVGLFVPTVSYSGKPVILPRTLLVPGGSKSTNFTMSSNFNTQVTNVIQASSGPYTKSATLTVNPDPAASLVSVTLDQTTVVSGNTVTGTVTLSGPAGPGTQTVTVASASTGNSYSTNVNVFAGQTSATFQFFAGDFDAPTAEDIVATLGTVRQHARLEVIPATLASVSVTPNPSVGSTPLTLTIALNGVSGENGTVISLQSSSSNLPVPSTVTTTSGYSGLEVPLTPKSVTHSETITITAKQGSITKNTTVTLQPARLSSLTFSPLSVIGSNPSKGTITLNGPAGSGGVICYVYSNEPFAVVPYKVIVPAGQSSVTFPITTNLVGSNTSARITVTSGDIVKSAILYLSAPELDGLTLSSGNAKRGTTLTGTVTLIPTSPSGGMKVHIKSSDPSISVPDTVLIPAGAKSANFPVKVLSSGADMTVTITASLNGTTYIAKLSVVTP